MDRSNLVEIKRGEEGTGLLIEHDGYISSECGDNKKLFEAINVENEHGDEFHCPYPFVVSAVFQKFGIENANGRIYPENILKREVQKYQSLIDQRMAMGECYTPDVMVLCKDGWKQISEVKEGEEVLTLNTQTNEIEIQKVERKIEYEYSGNMMHFNGRNISEMVTPNHGYPIYDINGKFKDFYTASDIYEKFDKLSHFYIPKTGNWTEKGDEIFVLKGIENPTESMLKIYSDCNKDISIPMSVFMKFLGIYLANGDYDKENNEVYIYKGKESISEKKIIDMLQELGLHYTCLTGPTGHYSFRICDPRLVQYVSQFGKYSTKHILPYIKNQSKENLRALYCWFAMGNGRTIDGDNDDCYFIGDVFSSSKQLSMDLNEIQLKIGYSGNYHIEDRLIEGENHCKMHSSLCSSSEGIYLDKHFLTIEEVPYEGQVMCIEVPNHTFYVMSNGRCHWSKNCNHPSESVIDLDRVAINIIELRWEGHTLVGKMEIITSPGYRKSGIISCRGDQIANLLLHGYKIGVSSRGLGTVTNKMGVLYVADDYEIVCWDVVSSPSTPGAYISMDGEEGLSQYVESKEKDESKDKLFEELDKFSDWLND